MTSRTGAMTEVPITQALMEHVMAPGPALALLLGGRPCRCRTCWLLVKVMGAKKTAAFSLIIIIIIIIIVVVVATTVGMLYGATQADGTQLVRAVGR